jgi:hypothetical protein
MGKPVFFTIADCESEARRIHIIMKYVYLFGRQKARFGVSIRICCAETWRLQPVSLCFPLVKGGPVSESRAIWPLEPDDNSIQKISLHNIAKVASAVPMG